MAFTSPAQRKFVEAKLSAANAGQKPVRIPKDARPPKSRIGESVSLKNYFAMPKLK